MEIMDLTNIACPHNFVKALIRLEGMESGTELKLIVDSGEPIANVPPALEEEGHLIISKSMVSADSWELIVRRS
jgi:TusA-related sulfurtransferase